MSFRMNEFEAYEKYVALKLHFTSEYDYFRYNGKTSVTLKSFNERKDRFHFKRLSKKYDDPTLIDYFLGPCQAPGGMLLPELKPLAIPA